MVESFDGSTRHKLPALIECDQIPNTREEIPTPEVVRHYQHLQDIALHFRPVDDNAEIQLLIGRDLIEAHHVFDQCIGPEHTPFAPALEPWMGYHWRDLSERGSSAQQHCGK